MGIILVVLRHAIANYNYRRLDKQWYNAIDLIAYNKSAALSIIASLFNGKYHLLYIDGK